MKIVSFFSGAGGLDRGFENSGFDVVWANEYDKNIWETFEKNHPNTYLDKRSIANIPAHEVPDCDGIIGGPPCQSWSEAGSLRGINDKRGQLFFEFIRILAEKQPKFFLAENVSGMLLPRHSNVLQNIKEMFNECGYELSFQLVNAADYGIPQDRKRVFFIGFRKDLNIKFKFPNPSKNRVTLLEAIGDLKDSAIPAIDTYFSNKNCLIPNHEYMTGGFSSMFMSRNRVRQWDDQSFTIQAGGRHAPLHPQAPKMQMLSQDKWQFDPEKFELYRRLTIREAARIQTFPDNFIFYYKNLTEGYKMVGNAVPVELATIVAKHIKKQLKATKNQTAGKNISNVILNAEMVKFKMNQLLTP